MSRYTPTAMSRTARFTKHEMQVMHDALIKYLHWSGDEPDDELDDRAAESARDKLYYRLRGDVGR